MGIGDKMNQMATHIQDGVKSTSSSLALVLFKLVSGFIVSLTITLITQEVMQFGTLSFVFMLTVLVGLFYKLMQSWSFGRTAVFDLVCFLVILIMRMYILIAP